MPLVRPARAAGVWAVVTLAAGGRAAAAQRAAPGDSASAPASAPAASPALPARPAAAGWEVAPFVGYGARSPSHFWGLTPGRNHLMLGVQFVRPLARLGAVTLAYAPNVVPVFVLSNNPYAGARPAALGPGPGLVGGGLVACEATRCGPVYGFGVAPAGLRLEARLLPRLAVYGAAAAGGVLFRRNVPVAEARRLNATAEWGGGVVVRAAAGAAAGAAVQAGYKYHHLSNAYTAARNPGVDGHVFYAGVQWRVRGGRGSGR